MGPEKRASVRGVEPFSEESENSVVEKRLDEAAKVVS
jgi:hypothetical protein